MTHRMILLDADFKTIKRMIVARRKESGRISTEASTSASYTENSSSSLEFGSTFDEDDKLGE